MPSSSTVHRTPHTATAEDLRRFQLHLANNCVSSKTINVTITGLRFLFEVTLEDHQILRKMSTVYEPRALPVILSPDEVKRLLQAATTLKHKAALFTAYGAGLLSVEYYHLVFTLPAPIRDIAYHNKAVMYQILFQTAARTLRVIAGDPKHLGARIGATLVLHTWGSAMTHHPYVHGIVAGGGFSVDGRQWIACKPDFFLPVRVLSRLFRRLFLEALGKAHQSGELRFFNDHRFLTDPQVFTDWLRPLKKQEWVVYAKRRFAGPEAVLPYLSRYTHRVAIANSRLLALDENGVTFKWKDYRDKGRTRHKAMTLATGEFIRRFLIHVLPRGFHRIRHYGWMANTARVESLAQARELMRVEPIATSGDELPESTTPTSPWVCPTCAAPMIIISVFERGHAPRAPPMDRTA